MCKDEDSNLIQWEGVEDDEYNSSGAGNDEKLRSHESNVNEYISEKLIYWGLSDNY